MADSFSILGGDKDSGSFIARKVIIPILTQYNLGEYKKFSGVSGELNKKKDELILISTPLTVAAIELLFGITFLIIGVMNLLL